MDVSRVTALFMCIFGLFWRFGVSESFVRDEGFVDTHVHTVNTLKHLICPKEPHVSGDVLSPLSRSLQQSLANVAVTPDLLPAKGSSLVFDILLYLKSSFRYL